jgi:hypothetical protein
MQILPENIKILTGILPDFCLSETVGRGGTGGGVTCHISQKMPKSVKPKFLPFPSVNCFKILHIS